MTVSQTVSEEMSRGKQRGGMEATGVDRGALGSKARPRADFIREGCSKSLSNDPADFFIRMRLFD